MYEYELMPTRFKRGECYQQPGSIKVCDGAFKVYQQYKAGAFLIDVLAKGDQMHLQAGCWLEAATQLAQLSRVPGTLEKQSRLLELERRIRKPLSQLGVKSRIAAVLCVLEEQLLESGQGLDLNLTREEFAHLTGTVYETVIRTFAEFKQSEIIRVEGRRIFLKDKEHLARIGQYMLRINEGEREALTGVSNAESHRYECNEASQIEKAPTQGQRYSEFKVSACKIEREKTHHEKYSESKNKTRAKEFQDEPSRSSYRYQKSVIESEPLRLIRGFERRNSKNRSA